jgi:putative MATE family efflux protein
MASPLQEPVLQSPAVPSDPLPELVPTTLPPAVSPVLGAAADTGDGGAQPIAGSSKLDLTQGSILRHVIRLAVPGALANLFNFSYNFVNMIWLGRLGPSALAVTTTYQYFFMVFVIFNQIVGLGSFALIARTYGAKDYPDCRRLIGQTFSFKLLIAFAVMALGLIFQRWAWVAFGSAPDVAANGVRYSTIMFCVIPIYFSTFTLNTALRGIGDMKRLMIISSVSTVLNLVIDPFLIFPRVFIGPFPSYGIMRPLLTLPGCGLGVAGAAWASFGSICVMFIMGLYYFTTGRTYIRVGWRQFFGWDWHTVWRILRIGTPPAVGENMTNIAQLIIGKVMNLFGTAVFAANGINGTLLGLAAVPLAGIGQAVTTMVGQNLGAGKPQRAERSVWLALAASAVLLVLGLGACLLLAEPLIRLFLRGNDAASLESAVWGARILRINAWAFLIGGISGVFGGVFWGSGDTRPPMWAALLSTWAVQLPIVLAGAYLFHFNDPYFIWWAGVAGTAVSGLYLFIAFRRGKWKTVRV